MSNGSRKHHHAGGRAFLLVLLMVLLPLLAQAQYPTFAIVSDSHVGAANSVYPAFIRAIEEAGIDTVIHTGDAINTPGSTKEWASFLEITGPAKQLYLAPGNHDISSAASLSVYLKYFPKLYYSFSEGDTLFVLLNTELPGEAAMVVGEQLAWLKTELARPFHYKFVFLHEPLFPVVSLHGLDRHRPERDQLHQLFVRSGVRLVVAGHDHIYDRTAKDGITYVIAGPTGGRLPVFAKSGDAFRYMVVTRRNESYSFLVKDMSGNTRDEFSVGRTAEGLPRRQIDRTEGQ
jgi:3',5'-cyclic AMP phosphodiesterase CpdA